MAQYVFYNIKALESLTKKYDFSSTCILHLDFFLLKKYIHIFYGTGKEKVPSVDIWLNLLVNHYLSIYGICLLFCLSPNLTYFFCLHNSLFICLRIYLSIYLYINIYISIIYLFRCSELAVAKFTLQIPQ